MSIKLTPQVIRVTKKAKDTIYAYVKSNVYGKRNQELPNVKEVEVTKIRNLGKKSLKEVLDKVEEMGLKFRD